MNAPLLPHRPNLDYLRRQAKSLLASIARGELGAIGLVLEHLPAAGGKSPAQVAAMDLRLADAQSVIARSTGFASWPRLARHVESLRGMEGEWVFEALVVDGRAVPAHGLQGSRVMIDGDRFEVASTGASYGGVFNIDVEPEVHHMDVEFAEGPRAGVVARGVFRMQGDELEICLDLDGRGRPTGFASAAGSGHAHHTLRRARALKGRAAAGGKTSSDEATESAMTKSVAGASAVYRLVPFVHVADVEASLAFYALLGFVPERVLRDAHARAFWALARSATAEIMLAQASGPVRAEEQAVLFYMYSADVAGLRSHLIASGVRDVGAYSGARQAGDGPRTVYGVAHPAHMPSGELRVVDVDGYVILVGQLA